MYLLTKRICHIPTNKLAMKKLTARFVLHFLAYHDIVPPYTSTAAMEKF